MEVQIIPYQDEFKTQIVSVWYRSVKATHSFLTDEDFEYFHKLVQGFDFKMFEVFCLISEQDILGFIGVYAHKIEMLFIDPAYIGKGLGSRLMDFAIKDLKADKVDVNAQNLHAVSFYEHYGFVMYQREGTDSAGKPYPILKMKII